MTEKTTRDELTPEERAFLKALDEGDEGAMISIFVAENGTKTMHYDQAAAPEIADIISNMPVETPTHTLDTDLTGATLKFIEAWKANDTAALQSLVDEKRGQPLPASHIARERTRARATPPDIRFRLMGILEEIQTLIDDTACRISRDRPNGKMAGVFEEDQIANDILRSIGDYLSVEPNANQISSEYHVYPFFDLEWDYRARTLTARDPVGKAQAVEDYSDPDEK